MLGYKDSSINIYIVDDDVLLLKILENKFKKSTGYNIYTFTSGEDFLHFYISNPVKKSHIQIVLLDYNLSTMDSHSKDGIEILKYIKEISSKVEVIVLSGYATELISEKMMRLGAAACIKKNENSHIRIQNTIKWIISEQLIKDKKKQSKITFVIFALILFAIVLTAIFNVLDIAI